MSEHEGGGFGNTLRRAREAGGLTLQDLAARTRVQERYLKALEADDWDAVPQGVIGRGFVRLVAREIGLDPEELLARYREARGSDDAEPVRALPEADWKVALRDDRTASPVLLILLLLIGAVLGIWVWSPWRVEPPPVTQAPVAEAPSPAAPEEPAQPPAAETAPSPPPPSEASAPSATAPEAAPAPAAEAAPAVPAEPVAEPAATAAEATAPAGAEVPAVQTLEIQAVEKTWVRVVADGDKTRQGVISPGERQSYEAEDKFAVRLGNAAGVRLFWNGEALKVPGAPGAVVNLAFPRDLEKLRP